MSRETSRVSTKSKTLRSNTAAFNIENKRPRRGPVVEVTGKGAGRRDNSRTVAGISIVPKRTSTKVQKNGSKQKKEKRVTCMWNHHRVL